MGLDAVIFCDCYEKGRLKPVPREFGPVYLLRNGYLKPRTDDADILERFDAWRTHACRHKEGMIAGDYLGNGGYIAWLVAAVWPQRKLFPILVGKVIYDGNHCGDHLSLRDVSKLAVELDRLKSFRTGEKILDKNLQLLRRKLEKLVRVALKIKKPIAF